MHKRRIVASICSDGNVHGTILIHRAGGNPLLLAGDRGGDVLAYGGAAARKARGGRRQRAADLTTASGVLECSAPFPCGVSIDVSCSLISILAASFYRSQHHNFGQLRTN
jgi:hypothetical protein